MINDFLIHKLTQSIIELVQFDVTDDQKVGMNGVKDLINKNCATKYKWTIIKDFDGIFEKVR